MSDIVFQRKIKRNLSLLMEYQFSLDLLETLVTTRSLIKLSNTFFRLVQVQVMEYNQNVIVLLTVETTSVPCLRFFVLHVIYLFY